MAVHPNSSMVYLSSLIHQGSNFPRAFYSIADIRKKLVDVDNCQTSSERREYMRLFPPFDENDEENIIKKSLKEWNIPYSDLQFGDKVGIGPKGHVYKGRWHGEIMIHTVKKSSKIDLEEFLKEAWLRKYVAFSHVINVFCLSRHGYASLPRGHLTYVPPEHMRKISWSENELELVQCCNSSVKTNVYVFGTLLYEIMTGRWPFSHFPVESIIWMVGKGKKQCLRHVKCPEKTKNLIRECWSDNSEDRPDFAKIVQFFQEHNISHECSNKRITGSHSEPEKIHMVGRQSSKLSFSTAPL
ncbi:predicted protein [Nematostella vectensis]|uniref:Protein kinase domain-containing protein n=1 Tax=Nematostella vectensis TaxID=45351 RepID=A7SVG7_NEMVE|nr:predicted protein [Nematostella vectensis]|eukprot:XP_001624389.1 predicted protein [Nematostella vectensis]